MNTAQQLAARYLENNSMNMISAKSNYDYIVKLFQADNIKEINATCLFAPNERTTELVQLLRYNGFIVRCSYSYFLIQLPV
jgi:hypothetical protein